MVETNQKSRLRRYLAAYERLCKKYGLIIQDVDERVYERLGPETGHDYLPEHIAQLKESGINA